MNRPPVILSKIELWYATTTANEVQQSVRACAGPDEVLEGSQYEVNLGSAGLMIVRDRAAGDVDTFYPIHLLRKWRLTPSRVQITA